ncbi:TRAP transporter small permease [Bacillus sp. FJAT-45350]|uniref:TRAP transporter small permease n=1 Tax=Bacillus sp. FJAT-45350 TaxID=2011014 RepID=UPI000BB8EDF5|nr:TRAP transporter small permease [Bacillus sp. FJAT-45350]
MNGLRKVNNVIEKGLISISVLMFITYIVLILLQVVARNYLHIPVLWAQEVALFCFLWTIFLGASIALRKRKHYLVEVFPAKMKKTNQTLSLVADILVLGFIYVLIVGGFDFAKMGLTRLSTALEIPQVYLFASIPIAGVAMLFFAIEVIAEDIKILLNKGEIE